MSYLDEGPRGDEAVLFLHGNPTWSFYYRDLVRELSPAIRCIAPDHVGMGLSEKPPAYDYRLSVRIDDIDAEASRLEKLGATRVGKVKRWWVMQAPTGQRFCVVQAKTSLAGAAGVREWGA